MSIESIDKLKQYLQDIKKEIDPKNGLFQNDKIAFNTQRIILETLLDTIPIAMEKFAENPKQSTANALSTLVTKVADLFGEIRQTQNLSNQVEYLTTEVIDPVLKRTINSMYDEMFFIKSSLKSKNLDDDTIKMIDLMLDEFLKKVSTNMVPIKEEAEQKIRNYLLEL